MIFSWALVIAGVLLTFALAPDAAVGSKNSVTPGGGALFLVEVLCVILALHLVVAATRGAL